MAAAAADELRRLAERWSACPDCRLSQGRTTVVVGNGDPAAELFLAGEAPGFHEDQQGVPFVGAAGGLLDELLAGIGLRRPDVFVANVLKCRPPGNRDPLPDEIEACRPKLVCQVELVGPRVVVTLGNFATRLLSGRPFGISRVRGTARRVTVGECRTVLYPVFHPAAALRSSGVREQLEADFARLPRLLEHLERDHGEPGAAAEAVADAQLGLF